MEVPHQIPKIIHYCWFGKTSLPEDAQRCIVFRIFRGADLAVIQQVLRLILRADEGPLHPFSGHDRLVQCLDAFGFLPGLDFRHQPTFFAPTTKRPFL